MKNSILYKLIVIFVVITVVPLALMGYFIGKNFETTLLQVMENTEEMGKKNLQSSRQIGLNVIEDAVSQLDKKSTQAIETRTVDLAAGIADFLYERDQDIRSLALHSPLSQLYLEFINSHKKDVILHGRYDSKTKEIVEKNSVKWKNSDNRTNWHHIPPKHYKKESKPLFLEITFVGINGIELIKAKPGKLSDDLQDISVKKNTWCKAENYFEHAVKLKKNELYVSKVIGEYVKGWMHKDDNGKIKVKPESAYAGKENQYGKKFQGLIRWVMPVYEGEIRIGYLTMALDHTHIMEFTDHLIPTEERFSDISDAGSGNYAFLWDFENQNISHPRDFFICGYDPATGMEVPGWLSEKTYREYTESQLSLNQFIETLPDFRNFTNTKTGSKDQLKAGRVALDCRVLDHAPQCQGWSRGTEDGGSGSFLILWSGLWKLTTYAAVPYFTGQYGNSPRGFGYVTLGANVRDFHQAANITRKNIEISLENQEKNIDSIQSETKALIKKNLIHHYDQLILLLCVTFFLVILLAVLVGLTFTKPLRRLIKGARAIGNGDYDQHIEITSKDEIGKLGETFNKMAYAIADSNNQLQLEIKERLKTEKALKESEKQFRNIFETAVEGIYQNTIKGKYITANPRMAEILGYESPDALMKEVTNIKNLYVDSSHRDAFLKILLHHGIVSDFETEMYRKDRKKVWVSINARAVKDGQGEFKYMEGLLIDITKRKEAEQKKGELQKRLARSKKMEALGMLAGGVAHDLNNILSGIIAYPELLLMELPEESDLRKPLEAIHQAGNRAAAVVADLITIARGVASVKIPLSLNTICEEYLVSPEFKQLVSLNPHVKIETDFDFELFNVNASKVHMGKIIMNLVSNAVEVCGQNGIVKVATENQYVDRPIKGYDKVNKGEYAVLSVSDNGHGISFDELNSIFEPFYTKKKVGKSGTGLGLAIVWDIIVDHAGYVDVNSSEKGTCFDLYFPVTGDEINSEENSAVIEEFKGNGETILVVDDEETHRIIACKMLNVLGYSAKAVSSGEEAVAYIKETSVDLIMLDMIMVPGIDGYETYKRIIEIAPGQKAIIVSGFAETENVKNIQQLGAGKYVKKPYSLGLIGRILKEEIG